MRGFPCIYQTLAVLRVLLYVTRTDQSYRPWILQQYERYLDGMWYFITRDWMKLPTLKVINCKTYSPSCVKLLLKVISFITELRQGTFSANFFISLQLTSWCVNKNVNDKSIPFYHCKFSCWQLIAAKLNKISNNGLL